MLKEILQLKYETILAMPDSYEKYQKLERKLLKLQFHDEMFFKAKDEWSRLWKIYHKERMMKK